MAQRTVTIETLNKENLALSKKNKALQAQIDSKNELNDTVGKKVNDLQISLTSGQAQLDRQFDLLNGKDQIIKKLDNEILDRNRLLHVKCDTIHEQHKTILELEDKIIEYKHGENTWRRSFNVLILFVLALLFLFCFFLSKTR